MRYHLFQKFFGKMVEIKKTAFLLSKCLVSIGQHCSSSGPGTVAPRLLHTPSREERCFLYFNHLSKEFLEQMIPHLKALIQGVKNLHKSTNVNEDYGKLVISY